MDIDKIIKQNHDGTWTAWDGLTIKPSPFPPERFHSGTRGGYIFNKKESEWLSKYLSEFTNTEMSAVLGVSIKTITKLRKVTGLISPKRQYELIGYINREKAKESEHRKQLLENMDKGRIKTSEMARQRQAQREAKKAERIANKTSKKEEKKIKYNETQDKKAKQKFCKDKNWNPTPVHKPKTKGSSYKEPVNELQPKQIKNPCIANCWLKRTKQCSTHVGNECTAKF